jgi:hypothetical protein
MEKSKPNAKDHIRKNACGVRLDIVTFDKQCDFEELVIRFLTVGTILFSGSIAVLAQG